MARKKGSMELIPLDPTVESPEVLSLRSRLSSAIIGQPAAVDAILDIYRLVQAGMHRPGVPLGKFLFLGPTGAGKTYTAEVLAELLSGSPKALIRVDCAEFQHSHEIAKLVGSPPGYLGHRETHPALSQKRLNECHKDGFRQSFVVFDEIEKGNDALHKLLLGILDKGTLTMGDNSVVDFSNTWVFLTSNLGTEKIYQMMANNGMGFSEQQQYTSVQLQQIVETEARKKFSPEFMNRLDRVVLYNPLSRETIETIFTIETKKFLDRSFGHKGFGISLEFTSDAKKYLIDEGYEKKNGARHLTRTIDKHLAFPLANLVLSGQLQKRDRVHISYTHEKLRFSKYKPLVLPISDQKVA
jgi:ATP-dependent Clp protease ATP-binding subunit ClpA